MAGVLPGHRVRRRAWRASGVFERVIADADQAAVHSVRADIDLVKDDVVADRHRAMDVIADETNEHAVVPGQRCTTVDDIVLKIVGARTAERHSTVRAAAAGQRHPAVDPRIVHEHLSGIGAAHATADGAGGGTVLETENESCASTDPDTGEHMHWSYAKIADLSCRDDDRMVGTWRESPGAHGGGRSRGTSRRLDEKQGQ